MPFCLWLQFKFQLIKSGFLIIRQHIVSPHSPLYHHKCTIALKAIVKTLATLRRLLNILQ
jgi:hypothetical protein